MDSRPLRAAPPAVLDLTRPEAYGTAFADVYDRWYGEVSDAEATASFVAERCSSGLVIELGVGSGRLARPLVERGLTVIGIDASQPMLASCPPTVHRVVADMSRLPFDLGWGQGRGGRMSGDPAVGPTVLCGFNTVFNVADVPGQERMWSELGAMGATVIVETADLGDSAEAEGLSTGVRSPADGQRGVIVTSTMVEPNRARVVGRHLEISDDGVVSRPWLIGWFDLDRLDTMAGRAGLVPSERYRSWSGEEYRRGRSGIGDTVITVYRPGSGDPAPRASTAV